MSTPNNLEQYQQSMRHTAAQEAQRQQSQEAPASEAPSANTSLGQRLASSVKEAMAQGLDNAKQYGKEVVTGQKLWEGISQNDGALDGWIAHGSTELANMLLHGHPAPVYARTLSPAEQQSEVESTVHGQATVENQAEKQAAVDVGLPRESSLEMYQRSMIAEQQHTPEQEIER